MTEHTLPEKFQIEIQGTQYTFTELSMFEYEKVRQVLNAERLREFNKEIKFSTLDEDTRAKAVAAVNASPLGIVEMFNHQKGLLLMALASLQIEHNEINFDTFCKMLSVKKYAEIVKFLTKMTLIDGGEKKEDPL